MSDGRPDDPRFTACIDFLRRTGMREFQFRYDEEQEPVVFVAGGFWADTFEADCSVDPLTAVLRLAERIGDGGQCAYCERPTGVSADWEHQMPLDKAFCWWVYDPETKAFRRGCEAEVKEKAIKRYPGVSRNDPCPCGSGKKYKRCHGQ